MTDILSTLDPTFSGKVTEFLAALAAKGVTMRPYFGIRTAQQQAKLWRQGRTATEIDAQVAKLQDEGCHFLADCIEMAGAQNGQRVTNAIGGLSWHNYGLALDCEWIVNGAVEWSTSALGALNGYKVYDAMAPQFGLISGQHWGDFDHVEMTKARSPLGQYTMQEIDAMMRSKFGEQV